MTARAKLGQHFLIRGSVLEKIARAVCPNRESVVIEIGPGRGALTAKLLDRAERVVAIEIDPYLANHLRSKFAAEPRLETIEQDILETDLAKWGRVPIAGNLPYYIASAIIERISRLQPPRAVFLIQNEVAQRLAAKPGSRDYGFLTVEIAARMDTRLLFGVPPAAFDPPPKVDSAVIVLEPTREPPPVDDLEAFLQFVAQCFRHKRKTLRNNLVDGHGRQAIDSLPEAGLRAEQLSMQQFAAIYRKLV
ncbi:MAG: ribosomal RNA small subunit methyltransferase A [Acidobacteriia bacterium]|nr:ribosomal RNA small subunit methyltransferase A [Terriglobia bacterium]